jgi:glycosyltransferase involved in cell wall biosynthesis
MPNSLLEAMASGLACVVPEQPVGGDVLGDAGVVTADNEPETLAAALVALADDPKRRACLGFAATMATEAWTLDAVLDRQVQLYDRVARRTK